MDQEEQHKHTYVYSGVVYAFAGRLPGSGAEQVRYYDRYFCSACLHTVYERLSTTHDSYQAIRFNATSTPLGAKLP